MHIKKLTYDTTDIAVDWDKDFFSPKNTKQSQLDIGTENK